MGIEPAELDLCELGERSVETNAGVKGEGKSKRCPNAEIDQIMVRQRRR
jgi:hypothetical protein